MLKYDINLNAKLIPLFPEQKESKFLHLKGEHIVSTLSNYVVEQFGLQEGDSVTITIKAQKKPEKHMYIVPVRFTGIVNMHITAENGALAREKAISDVFIKESVPHNSLEIPKTEYLQKEGVIQDELIVEDNSFRVDPGEITRMELEED